MRFLFCFLFSVIASHAVAQEPQVRLLAQAESFLSREDTVMALDKFREILNVYPDSYPAALRLTEVTYQQEDYRQAIQYSYVTEDILNRYIDSLRTQQPVNNEDIQRARRYARDLADIRMLKGKIRLKQNRPVDALHELRQALDGTDQPSDVYIDIGLAHVSLGNYDEAAAAFRQSLDLEPLNKGGLFNLGNLFYSLKEYDSARHYYEMTYERFPELKYPLLYLGNIATFNQEYEKAIDYLSDFIQMDSNSDEAYFKRAVLYSELRQWENAIRDWDQSLLLNNSSSEAWRNRGLAHFQLKNYEQALEDFNQAILRKEEPFTFVNRGYTYYLLGEYEAALKDLDQGLSDLDSYALGYYFRALTHLELNNNGKACDDLEKAVEHGMNEEEINKKLRRKCR